jgi:hypothetical protein
MWWDHQNLDKPRRDKRGKRWNFRVWHGTYQGRHAERIFFWDDKREFCGVVLISPSVHVSRLHQFIEKLVADPDFRAQHKRDISFPLERHFSEYGAFPEETLS